MKPIEKTVRHKVLHCIAKWLFQFKRFRIILLSIFASFKLYLPEKIISDMKTASFELSARGVGDAASMEVRNFVFVVGGVEYECCRFQACFVSGLVRRLLASDCCLSRVCLQVVDDGGHFQDVVSLMNGRSISITPENARFLEACARELENDELLGRIVGFQLDCEDISLSNVVDRLRIKREFHSDCGDELDFLASHFFEADLDVVRSLSVSDLELVLANPLLKLESEDQLYDTIVSLSCEKGEGFLVLLRYVEFAFLSEPKLIEFLEHIFPCFVDASVWVSICACLRRFCSSKAKEDLMKSARYHSMPAVSSIEFDTFSSTSGGFNGIVAHLRGECGGNPHEKGVISITASSTESSAQCHEVVDYGWSSFWFSKDEPNSFIQFDFKSRRVCLSGYSLKSHNGTGQFFVSWVIEVSDDGSTWEAVDERNTQDLVGANKVKTYECSRQSNKFVRFVRMRQTGKNNYPDDYLILSQIEFFGKLTK